VTTMAASQRTLALGQIEAAALAGDRSALEWWVDRLGRPVVGDSVAWELEDRQLALRHRMGEHDGEQRQGCPLCLVMLPGEDTDDGEEPEPGDTPPAPPKPPKPPQPLDDEAG